jgi:hypothetical protein
VSEGQENLLNGSDMHDIEHVDYVGEMTAVKFAGKCLK